MSPPQPPPPAAVARYRGGPWHGLVIDGALALLHPEVSPAVAGELWLLAEEGKRLSAWVEYLARAGIRTLPSFAMVEAQEDGVRVLVRGEVEVRCDGQIISGRDYTTWREELISQPTEIELHAAAVEAPWWPIRSGVVGAAQLRAHLSAGPARATLDDEADIELTVARMPAIAAALEESPGGATKDAAGDYDHLLWSTEQQHAAAAQPPPPEAAPEAPPELEATREPEPEHTAHPPQVEESPWQPTTDKHPPAPTPEHRGTAQPAPEGIIDSVPPWLRPTAPTPAAAPPATVLHPELSPPPATPSPPPAPPAPVEPPAARYTLVLSTGQHVPIDGPVLVGRAPEAARFGGDVNPRLIRVPNPQKDISATHVEVRPAGDHVVVTDMNSTNGTVVHHPAQPSLRLQPGTGVPLAAGTTIDLGGVTLRVEKS